MPELVRVAAFCLGLLIVVSTAVSVFATLVMPRVTSSRLLRSVTRTVARVIKLLIRPLDTYEAKDRVMALVGPLGIVLLFVAWLGLFVVGFGLMIWWASGAPLATALGASGSSIFTLGIITASRGGAKVLDIFDAGTGFLAIALAIAYLPALYSSFSAREAEVTLLAGRGGTPNWGPEVLSRHVRFKLLDQLPELYVRWERWAAAVSESHTSYPSLMWFRSPDPTRSWLLALLAILDAAALHAALAPDSAPRQARLCLRMGINCLRSLADALHIRYDPDPLPSEPIRLTESEFGDGFSLLSEVGFPIERSKEESWRQFAGWRVNYEPIVDAMTLLLQPPPAPWLIDRPAIGQAHFPLILNRTPEDPGASAGRAS